MRRQPPPPGVAEGQGLVAGELVNTASRIQSAAQPREVIELLPYDAHCARPRTGRRGARTPRQLAAAAFVEAVEALLALDDLAGAESVLAATESTPCD